MRKRLTIGSHMFVSLIGAFCGPLAAQDVSPDWSQGTELRVASRIGMPVLHDEVIYFGTEEGLVYAVDVDTGREIWRFKTGGPALPRPRVQDGTVYIGSQDGWLRALDASTGELRWSFEAGNVDWPVRDIFINGTPTVVDGVVYFSSEDFNVYALDARTGVERWRLRLGEEPQALEIPIVDGVAYIGAWDGFLYAIDVAKGEIRWRSDTDNDHIGRTVRDPVHGLRWISDNPSGETLSNQAPYVTVVPIVTGEAVFFSDWAGNLMAVDRATGVQQWRFKPPTANSRHVGSRSYIVMFDDVLFYSTLEDRHLYGVDASTGQQVWQHETEGMPHGPMYLEDGVALFGELILNDEGQHSAFLAHALDLRTRKVLWTTDDLTAFPFVKNGVVYFGGGDGAIHARDLRSGREVERAEP